ncbi:hypothetical protein BWI97_08750 [Siphonobacter sp. BAB-5405]|uniref:hypothetical protein n=1 Tax=Siphonobacter sp. BAB-5405 TaxID=1864825 RepID=UPI000C80802A|nr:hypothetical protein [Siphonobacter sp. BAB-5405]PMD97688.1 hypothetical protein BWI97_08750 [Siphonobacter sp. BAB-5405]
MASFKLGDLAASLEMYARDNEEHIFEETFIPGLEGIPGSPIVPIADYMRMMPAMDEVVLSSLQIGSVVQPGAKNTFNPTTDAVNIKPRIGKIRPIKVDLLFDHQTIIALYKSYLGECRAKKIDPEVVPLEEYIKRDIVRQAKEDIRVQSLWNGVYNKANTTPLDVMDGLKTQLLLCISEGETPAGNIADTAPITRTNAVAETQKVLDIIPDKEMYSNQLICVCAREYKTAYELDFQAKHGSLPYNTSQEKGHIVGTNIQFVVEPGLSGFNRPIITKRNNFVYLYDEEGS